MKKLSKNNLLLIAAFALPVLLIIIVALTTYVPSIFIKTSYNFIYATCDLGTNYSYASECNKYLQQRYQVINNQLVINYVPPVDYSQDSIYRTSPVARLFIHDTSLNQSREISEADAQKMQITGLLTSPDGVTVNGDYNSGANFFLFYDTSSSYNHYLTKGNHKKKLNLINQEDRYYYRENFKFIGWVNQQ